MKVGDYVRFKNGEIEKIHSFAEKDNPLFNILINARYHNTNEIMKYGEPIDLIEVGDYVNGKLIIALRKDIKSERSIHMNSKDNLIFTDYDIANDWYYGIDTDKIKSIVTKEQFESVEYKVGE